MVIENFCSHGKIEHALAIFLGEVPDIKFAATEYVNNSRVVVVKENAAFIGLAKLFIEFLSKFPKSGSRFLHDLLEGRHDQFRQPEVRLLLAYLIEIDKLVV